MNKAKLAFLASLSLAAFTLSCSGDDGGNSSPSNSKAECVLNMLADDSQTPANIMAICDATESEVLAHLPENIGECETAGIDIGKTLGVIAEECGVGQIPIQISSSSSSDASANASSSSGSSKASSSSDLPISSGGSSSSKGSSSSSSSSSLAGDPCANFDGRDRVHEGKTKRQFCDPRDGKKYVYVDIGDQTWMAENLNYNASGSKCYNGQESYCDIYGRLYDWDTAYEEYTVNYEPVVKSVCPDGWHLPTSAEWTTLRDYVESDGGCTSCAGTRLKANAILWFGTSFTGASDDHGFAALPGGYGYNGSFSNASPPEGYVNANGYWWSSTPSGNSAYILKLEHSKTNALADTFSKIGLLSVRCVKDG